VQLISQTRTHRPSALTLLAAALLSTWTPRAGAAPKDPIQELLEQPARPTVADLQAALQPWPSENPFLSRMGVVGLAPEAASMIRSSPAARAQQVQTYVEGKLPSAIAQMERVFPGATWAPLGRDAVALGDALDAFYHSFGQPDRVVRLDASTRTLENASATEIVTFLESAGLDFDPTNAGAKPFVMVDFTQMGTNSQSTKIMRAGYQEFQRRGGKAEDFVKRFNLITLRNDGFVSGKPMAATADLTALSRSQRFEAQTGGMFKTFVRIDGITYPEGVLLYAPAWHDRFDALQWSPDGKRFGGAPGTPTDPTTRLTVLSDQFELIQEVTTPAFRQQVEAHALSLGYAFPTHSTPAAAATAAAPAAVVPAAAPAPSPTAELERAIQGLGPKGPQLAYLSANGAALVDLIQRLGDRGALTGADLIDFQAPLHEAYVAGTIGANDYRRLVARTLEYADPLDARWARNMGQAARLLPRLGEILVTQAEFSRDPTELPSARFRAAYQTLERTFLPVLRCQLKLTRS
jgi:hypothetical protein